jgi:hypothetical protein
MFKPKNYGRRALSTFEIIGSFIVDLYYNHFYDESKRLMTIGKVDSITDGYKHAVNLYIRSYNNPKAYSKTIAGVHRYYRTTTKFTTISFGDCIKEITSHFIPEEFQASLTNTQRDGVLRRVLLGAVTQFSKDVLQSNIIDTIIDNHSDKTIVRSMQDKMVESLMYEREKMFQKVFDVSHKPNGGHMKVVQKMKAEVVKLLKANHGLSARSMLLKNQALELLNIAKDQKAQLDESRVLVKRLNEQHIKDKNRIKQLLHTSRMNNSNGHTRPNGHNMHNMHNDSNDSNGYNGYGHTQTPQVSFASQPEHVPTPVHSNYTNSYVEHVPSHTGNTWGNSVSNTESHHGGGDFQDDPEPVDDDEQHSEDEESPSNDGQVEDQSHQATLEDLTGITSDNNVLSTTDNVAAPEIQYYNEEPPVDANDSVEEQATVDIVDAGSNFFETINID